MKGREVIMAEEVRDYIEKIFAKNPLKIVVSKAVSKDVRYRKITVVRKEKGYQIERLTQKQAFHENVSAWDEQKLIDMCAGWLGTGYGQLNAWTDGEECSVMVSKKVRHQWYVSAQHSSTHRRLQQDITGRRNTFLMRAI